MSCCSNAIWKYLVSSGEVRAGTFRAAAAAVVAPAAPADETTIFVNGTFLLAEPRDPKEPVTAVAIANGLIADVGADARLRQAYPGATIVDLRGETLAPGFVEAHAHIIAATQRAYSTNLRGKSYEEVLETIAEKSKAAQPGAWLYFRNFDPSLMTFDPELGYPQLGFTELDAMPNASSVNIFVQNASGHIAYANSTAFATCGITVPPPLPPQGGWYDVEDGKLTGVMFEPPTFQPFLAHTKGMASSGDLFGQMLGFLAECQRAGITTVCDPAVGIGGHLLLELELYDILAGLPISTDVVGSIDCTCLYGTTNGPKITVPGLNAPSAPGANGSFGANLIVPAVKIWSDGSTQGYTGYLSSDYLPPVTPKGLRVKSTRGEPDWTAAQLRDLLSQAKADHWGALIHANGDAGLAMALEALGEVYGAASGYRNRIEHCTVTTEAQYDVMRALGVTPSYLTNHIAIWGDAFNEHILGPDRAARLDAAADAVSRGMIFSLHCDFSTSLPGPLRYMQTAVTRKTSKGVQLGAALAISATDALKAVTIYPAQQLGLDGMIGTITTGKRANLVHLAQDPTTIAPDRIASIPIRATYLHGREIPVYP